jgi:hypothetical protein
MLNYQEEKALEVKEPSEANFATIGAIYEDGVSLIFDGPDTEPSGKHYKCNSFVVFQPGDPVRILKDSGTYVVEYSVGNPKTTLDADTLGGKTAAQLSIEYVSKGHNGSTLKFFSEPIGAARQTCKAITTTTPTVTELKTKINELLDDLSTYGLIYDV